MAKSYSWRSYSFLTVSVIVLILIMLLDPLATAFSSEKAASIIMISIFIGALISIILAVITFANKLEKRLIPVVAVIITILNAAIILFFLWFGANFA